jgi:hypothetical protein
VEGTTITGILDWEFAGWYPAYWEFISTMGPAMEHLDYIHWVPEFLEPNWQALAGMLTSHDVFQLLPVI